jgi:hypothetical protein
MKPWHRSKTIWVNALAAGLVALEAVTGLLQPHLPLDIYVAVAVGLPVLNAMLRVITSEAIK